MVRYLLSLGANAEAITESRHLTYLHLLILVPREFQTDHDILECLRDCNIDVNVKEEVDGITALHLAVRNQKLQMTRELLQIGADPSIAVNDQLHLLSQGKHGRLEKVPDRFEIFTKDLTTDLTILGEVVIQYIQDGFYEISYVADLIVVFLDSREGPNFVDALVIDRGNDISLLHLLAVIADPESEHIITKKESHVSSWDPPKPSPGPISAKISLLQLALLRTPTELFDLKDHHGDTPLRYACAAGRLHNVQSLLSFGADPHLRNRFGLNAVEILVWSVIFLGRKKMAFSNSSQPWHPDTFPGTEER
jgi:ankyrin repeat protein